MIVQARAKLNLCLFVGPRRDDGLHELVSVFEPLELADELEITDADGPEDEVVVEGVKQPDLTARALAALREAGWGRPPVRIEVTKRVPVAAGLGGGSADAAAVLRLARGEVEGLRAIASALGADIPSQLDQRPCLVGGAGELVEPIPPPADHGVVLIPFEEGLATADVYAEADRLGSTRPEAELEVFRRKLRDATLDGDFPLGHGENLINDLEPAAVSLRAEITGALEALRAAGAERALVTGSGPTAFGLFGDRASAEEAHAAVRDAHPRAVLTAPLDPGEASS